MKHNTGKWIVEPTTEDHLEFKVIAIGDESEIAQRSVAAIYKNNQHLGRAEANAKLIAAAPELFTALKNLINLKKYKELKGKNETYNKEKIAVWNNANEIIKKASEK